MRDFEGAGKLYEKIADSSEYQGSLFKTRARLRAQILSDYKKDVFFVQVQKPPIEQQSGQQTFKPLELETPLTGTGVTSQKDLGSDFNLAK
jgi:hypothetical protein